MRACPEPHGGDWRGVADRLGLDPTIQALDFSVNLNPLGMPPAVERLLAEGSLPWAEYPEPFSRSAVAALATAHRIKPSQVIVGNGSTEILSLILNALKPVRTRMLEPGYNGFPEACLACGLEKPLKIPLGAGSGFQWHASKICPEAGELLFLCTPNNPTGTLLPGPEILKIAEKYPNSHLVVDESFLDFIPDPALHSLISSHMPPNLIVLKSLTKFFCIPGVRLGLGISHPQLACELRRVQLPWSVNAAAQAVAGNLYADGVFIDLSRKRIGEYRRHLEQGLSRFKEIKTYPSRANFLYCEIRSPGSAEALKRKLLNRGILIRTYPQCPGARQFFRLAVKTPEQNNRLLAALEWVFTGKPGSEKKQDARAIMIAGAASDAGKSLLVTALCRSLFRRGVKVAPFKAQNMSLNSWVSGQGGEMGRAQVAQARAAGLEPHTDMNPILLKPAGKAGSQVIVNGQPAGNHRPGEYYAGVRVYEEAALAAYRRLASQHDVIVLEGAGGAAEINLRHGDFVNLPMAEKAGASVILTADIELGGVFASLYGTVKLLPARHRALIKGIIINKFRGDKSLLNSGIKEIEQLLGIPVLGVMPWLKNHGLDEEDSVALGNRNSRAPEAVDIAVMRLPHISNFTDFQPLEKRPGVTVRYISHWRALGNPDLIILPGSKNVLADLDFLAQSGLAAMVKAAPERGIPVLGICGGYQMLGMGVSDPHGVEGEPGQKPGLALLPLETVLMREKVLSQVTAENLGLPFLPGGLRLEGYEIHMGETRALADTPPLFRTLSRGGDTCGEFFGHSDGGRVFGCYLHGLFDAPGAVDGLLNWLCGRKGISPGALPDFQDVKPDGVYNRLADAFEEHININRILTWVKQYLNKNRIKDINR